MKLDEFFDYAELGFLAIIFVITAILLAPLVGLGWVCVRCLNWVGRRG